MHTLGLAGNYAIPLHLQSAASNYGLRIEHLGGKDYKLRAEETAGPVDIARLCPESIERNDNIFDLQNLRRFTEFLHQPIRAGVASCTPPKTEKTTGFRERVTQRKANEAHIHKHRTTLHRLLRFAVTGSVEIPQDIEEGLDKETAECHAATEQAMRDEDTWHSEIEFGNTEDKISSIPGTAINPQKGFQIQLAHNGADLKGAHQIELMNTFWDMVNTATKNQYTHRPPVIHLSGSELETFCHSATQSNLGELVDRVEFEESVQAKLNSIDRRVKNFSALPLSGHNGNKAPQLRQLMDATSALTPLMGAEYMRKAWTRHNFTERHASPLEGLQKEMATFLTVANLYAQNGNTSPAQMEALAHEFYSLIAFSAHIAEALDNGLEKQALGDPENSRITDLRQELKTLRQSFHDSSIAGLDLNASFLSDDQRDALETLRKYAGKPSAIGTRAGKAVTTTFKAGSETLVEFTGDVVNFIREDPKVAAAFVGLAGALLYMKGGDPAAAQALADYGTALQIGDDGNFVDVAVDATNVPKDLFGNENFHWDLKFSPLKGYELYKHFANANFIVGPSQQFMEWIRSNIHGGYALLGIPQNYESVFDKTANAVINPLANRLFAVNMFQNVSHAAFWMWAFSRGYEHGPRGFSKLFELAGPITNLGVQAAGNIADQFRSTTALSEHLMNLKSQTVAPYKYEGNFEPADIIAAMGDAAQQRAELEAQLPADIQPLTATLSIDAMNKTTKRDSLSRAFTIGHNNYRPVLNALQKFDHIMTHAGTSIAAEETGHINNIVQRIHAVQNAMDDYAQTGDIEALNKNLDENLEYVLAAELRYRGQRSHIYEALFEDAPDPQAYKRLMRSANTTAGKERRAHSQNESKAALRGEGETPLKLTGHVATRTKMLAVNMWGGMVSSAKTLRRGTDRAINKRNVIIGSGIASACVFLDLAGAGNDFSNAVSGATGGTIAGSATIATFLNFNFWEDIIGVHVGTGVGLLLSGAAAGYSYKRGIRPALITGLETRPGAFLRKRWATIAHNVGNMTQALTEHIDKKNTQWGHTMTQRARRIDNPEYETGMP